MTYLPDEPPTSYLDDEIDEIEVDYEEEPYYDDPEGARIMADLYDDQMKAQGEWYGDHN